MHKLPYPQQPETFAPAVSAVVRDCSSQEALSQNARWTALRDTQSAAYADVRKALEKNQNGLCAYCEIKLSENNKQIEHFIPKSRTTPNHDFTFSFSNFLLCCKGGTNSYSRAPYAFSDDPCAKANHTCGESKQNINPEGNCLNPYELPDFPIFREVLTTDGIAFTVDEQACSRASIDPALVEKTLHCLNLNCARLCKARKAVWSVIDEEISQIMRLPKEAQQAELEALADTFLQPDQAFYTAALLCLANELPYLIL